MMYIGFGATPAGERGGTNRLYATDCTLAIARPESPPIGAEISGGELAVCSHHTAAISTSWVLHASCVRRGRARCGSTAGMSLMITALVRSSAIGWPPLGEKTFYCGNNVLGARVAQEAGDGDFLHRQCFCFLLGAPRFQLPWQRGSRSDTENVAFQGPGEVVVLQNDVQ